MKPHIDPKVDFVFKMLLGNEQHKGLLVHFLNAVLADEPRIYIQTVELLNPFNEREFENNKLSVVDVKARDEAGRWYQIEIQLLNHAGLIERILYTLCTLYHRQLEKGKAYTTLKPVIGIWILNEPLFDLPGLPHLPFTFRNEEHNLLLSEDLRVELLQLPEWPGPQETHNELDRWFCLFREGEEADTDALPDLLQSDEMKEAIQVLNQISESQREYFIYQQRYDALSLEATKQEEREKLEREKKKLEREKKKLEREKEKTERKLEEAQRKTEEAQRKAEETQQEKERLLALLREAGIDPM